jgi:hypothetical protein
METDIMAVGNAGQTASNLNVINGADHRWVGSGTNEVISVTDFAKAKYALQKANVPMVNLVAIVDPSVEYTLGTLSQLTGMNDNPRWEGIVNTGMSTGMKFIKNIYGFDVYTSNYLPLCGASQSGASETISTVASGANAVCNLFFSAASDVRPWVGAWRQMPKVESEYNKDFQREEHVTTARYGLKIFRPENLVTVLSNPAAVG